MNKKTERNRGPEIKPPATSKFSLFLVGGLVFVMIFIGGYKLLSNSSTSPTQIPSTDSGTTANWNTYSATANPSGFTKYEIKYPQDNFDITFIPSKGEGEDYTTITSKNIQRDAYHEVENGLDASIIFVGSEINDTPLTDSQIGSLKVKKWTDSQRGFTFIRYYIPIPQSDDYLQVFIHTKGPDSEKYLFLFDQILSTFTFLDQNNEANSTGSVQTIPVVSLDGWKAVSQNGVGFMIPPGGRCLTYDTYQEVGDNCSLVYKNESDKTAVKVRVEDYKGGSRREQFLSSASYTDCNFIFQEGLFGNVKALQIAAEAGLCQGNAGGIVVVIGNKLVIIENLFYNPDTNNIDRNRVQDTIVSTLRPN